MQNTAQIIQYPIDDNIERQLKVTGDETVAAAKSLVVDSTESYERAAGFLREIKARAARIEEYWKPTKTAAKAAHQAICDKEKAMLKPIGEAESIIKRAMSDYHVRAEAQRLAAEKEAARLAQQERDRLLEKALKAEESGNSLAAQTNLIMAEMVEDMKPVAVIADNPKAAGISARKVWKARITNRDAVPALVNGVEIRPIDMTALCGIARLTKGTAVVPGVEFYEEPVISARK